jgi:hypothetical protein
LSYILNVQFWKCSVDHLPLYVSSHFTLTSPSSVCVQARCLHPSKSSFTFTFPFPFSLDFTELVLSILSRHSVLRLRARGNHDTVGILRCKASFYYYYMKKIVQIILQCTCANTVSIFTMYSIIETGYWMWIHYDLIYNVNSYKKLV